MRAVARFPRSKSIAPFGALMGFCLSFAVAGVLQAQVVWKPVGAAPNTRGQTENVMPNNEVVGAINAVAVHPADANKLYVGAVNGGIWKTDNAMAASPAWTILTDAHESLAIGAIEFDPTDASHNTLVAGLGGSSSFGTTGSHDGVLRTVDGVSWTLHDGGGAIAGLNISGVAPRGAVIVISAAASSTSAIVGVWRSADHGATWSLLSAAAGSGLPAGRSFDLCGNPTDPKVLYVHAGNGIYRSADQGATWTKISNPAIDGLLSSTSNVDIAIGRDKHLFVAIVGGRRLAAVFHSADEGANWDSMGVPSTAEGGIHPGGQGRLHMSLAADPQRAHIVYIGGDRQDLTSLPNSIGANDFTGCLFRGDASKPLGQQWVHLTHSKTLGAAGGGTASNSSPHADSRAMAIAANGVLIEGDDGGVYRRTSPHDNTGDWFSANGNLQTSEYHAVAWDSNANVVVAGAQDTGSSETILADQSPFRSISTADGGVVAVDDKTTPGISVRFSSNQFLGSLRRRTFNAANVLQSAEFVPLTAIGGGAVEPQFYTPLALNGVAPKRMLIGAANGLFESLNRGDTVRLVGPGIVANQMGQDSIAYGAADNPDAAYVGAAGAVFVRSAAHPTPFSVAASYSGGTAMSIVVDPDHWKTAFVVDPLHVFSTADGGATWTDLTGNLLSLRPRTLRSAAFIPGAPPLLIVGADKGVFARLLAPNSNWMRLGNGLPKVPIYHLEYDAADAILIAGTLGRGAWTVAPVAETPPPETIRQALVALADEAPAAADDEPAEAPAPRTITLREGLVADPSSQSVYLMLPRAAGERGRIEAVNVVDGASLWTTAEAQKPLSAGEGRLVAQAATEDLAQLKVNVLSAQSGELLQSAAGPLAAGAKSLIDDSAEERFTIWSSAAADAVTIAWQFDERLLQGVPPGVLDDEGAGPVVESGAEPGAGPGDAPQAIAATGRVGARSGTFHLAFGEEELRPLNVETPDAPMFPSPLAIEPAAELPEVEGEQSESLDGEHIVGSVLTGDDAVWDKYTLSVYKKANGERVGQLKSHFAVLPLAVVGDRFVTVHEPVLRVVDGEEIEEPSTVRAYDREGNEVWRREVRDTVYRGPMPP